MIRLCAFSDEAGDGLNEQIQALRRNGIPLCEFRSVGGKNVSRLSVREAEEIYRTLSGEGIAVWSVGSPLGKCEIEISAHEWEEQVKNICAIANALRAERVRAFSFFHAYEKGELVIERMIRAAEIAKGFGVALCHENEKEVYGDTYERVSELMKKATGWKFVYDPANFVQVGEQAETTLALAPACDYYHIKDVVRATDELVPAGEGDGKISKLLALIDKDTVLTLEPHLAVFSAFAQIDNSEMKHRYSFGSNAEAFDAAADALKKLLAEGGWKLKSGGYEKDGGRT